MKPRTQGMHWIRPVKRLAIYLRDGMACVYCGESIENSDVRFTLDHLKPYSQSGSNRPTNLVTACVRCNSRRGKRSWMVFCLGVAEYLGCSESIIIDFVQKTRRRKLNMVAAKQLINQRGGFSAVMKGGKNE